VAFVDSTPSWAWVGAGAAIGLATSLHGGGQPSPSGNGDLQRHLAWCRRREERAHLLVIPLADVGEQELSGILESFRITDSVTLRKANGGAELYTLLDDKGFVREGLERRLSELRGGRSSFGWATFPDDGVTIQTLIEHARDQMRQAREQALLSTTAPDATQARTPALEHATGSS
jgi:hypothetical protein